MELANQYAAFDGETSEADLVITKYFPNGFWIAEIDSEIVGFAYGYFKEIPQDVLERWNATKVGYVALVAVVPRYRRRGIASSLLKQVISEFKKAGADLILLDSPSSSVGGQEMFEKLGFTVRSTSLQLRLRPTPDISVEG